jgi:hypothetical protein
MREVEDRIRDRQIQELWELEFLTLEAIGQRFNISRERVRQILSKRNAISPSEQRELKRKGRIEHMDRVRDNFGTKARELARSGAGKAEVIQTLEELFYDFSRSEVEKLFKDSGVRVLKVRDTPDRFSDVQLQLAVYLCFGLQFDAALENNDFGHHFSWELQKELVAQKESAHFPSSPSLEEIINAVGFTLAKREQGVLDPFPHSAYEQVRRNVWRANGWVSGIGGKLWPPTQQTIAKRLGGGFWGEATGLLGFPPSEKSGRSRGGGMSDPELVESSLAEFLRFCSLSGENPTSARFDSWRLSPAASGRRVPSSGTVRKVLGGWAQPVNALQFRLHLISSSTVADSDEGDIPIYSLTSGCIHGLALTDCQICAPEPV